LTYLCFYVYLGDMKKISKNLLFLAIVLPLNFIGAQFDHSGVAFAEDLKSSVVTEEIVSVEEAVPGNDDIDVLSENDISISSQGGVVKDVIEDVIAVNNSRSSNTPNNSCVGDLNGDGFVNDADVQILNGLWNTSNSKADLNNDGKVNADDLAILLGSWGACSETDPPSSGGGNGNGNNGGRGGSSGGSYINRNGSQEVVGEVLGTSTCDPFYLKEYLRMDLSNNPEEVKKLQTFLNEKRGANLPVTGFFGEQTLRAVNDFQLTFNKLILKPWVDAGLMENDTQPTGYVYKTTRFWVNFMHCPSVQNMVMPELI
jgi:hypothetical protein